MYIISGNHYSKGILGDDSSTLNQYWELGWECGVSNIYIKQLLSQGKLNSNDTVVTRSGREFFYSSVFDNVIDWETFCQLNIDKSHIVSIPDMLDISKLLEYDYLNVNKDLVCNFDLNDNIEKEYNITDKFMIYCVRLRDHGSYRNADINVTSQLINLFISDGYKVFIVGQGAEFLEEKLDVTYVDLKDYASLLASKYCKFCISTLSGIIHLANFCGHEDLSVFVLDHYGERRQNDHPIYMGDNINYKNIKTKFIPGSENYEVIKKSYEKFVKNEKTI
jgi:hypothetical protein